MSNESQGLKLNRSYNKYCWTTNNNLDVHASCVILNLALPLVLHYFEICWTITKSIKNKIHLTNNKTNLV